MKKILLILTAFAAFSCAPKDPVRLAIEQEIIPELANPKSYKFVSCSMERELHPEDEAARVKLYMLTIDFPERTEEGLTREYMEKYENARAEFEAKEKSVEDLGASLPADLVISRIYRFNYRADVPGEGRDFPVEVFALIDAEGKCLGIASSAFGVYQTPITTWPDFIPFTK